MENLEKGQSCSICGGEVDESYRISRYIMRGRCFRCGQEYNVLSKDKEKNKAELV